MAARDQLIQELGQVSDSLVEEVLDFLKFIKARQDQQNLASDGDKGQISKQSVLERMGGIPQYLLSVGNLSDRDHRREIIASRIQKSHQHKSWPTIIRSC
jgi:hypothetical protein